MGLLIALTIILVIGFVKIKNFNTDIIWQALAVCFFYWLGTLFAPISAVLSFSFSLSTIIAGFFYAIAGIIVWMKIRTMF